MPAGSRVLPFRSNIPEISKFTFWQIDEQYYDRAMKYQNSGSLVVGGENYGQGSSREHAAIAPRYLGVRAVIAKSYARIHWQNLINFGILPLQFVDPKDCDSIQQEDVLAMSDVRQAVQKGNELTVTNKSRGSSFRATHNMSPRQVEMLLLGGLINLFRKRHQGDH